jgi:hypothetical protein
VVLQGREREDRGKGIGKTKWERIPEKAFPTHSSLWFPFDFPVLGYL